MTGFFGRSLETGLQFVEDFAVVFDTFDELAATASLVFVLSWRGFLNGVFTTVGAV